MNALYNHVHVRVKAINQNLYLSKTVHVVPGVY